MNIRINSDNVRWWIKGAVLSSIIFFVFMHFMTMTSEPYKAASNFIVTDNTITQKYGQSLRFILMPYGNSYHIEQDIDSNGKVVKESGTAIFVFWVWGSSGHGSVSVELEDKDKNWKKVKTLLNHS